MLFWHTGYFLNFIAIPFLVVAVAVVIGVASRKLWTGAVVGLVAATLVPHPELPLLALPLPLVLIWVVVYSTLGLLGCAVGWFLRDRRLQPAVICGVWACCELELLYMYSLTIQVHTLEDFLFGGTLLAATVTLGGVTVTALSKSPSP